MARLRLRFVGRLIADIDLGWRTSLSMALCNSARAACVGAKIFTADRNCRPRCSTSFDAEGTAAGVDFFPFCCSRAISFVMVARSGRVKRETTAADEPAADDDGRELDELLLPPTATPTGGVGSGTKLLPLRGLCELGSTGPMPASTAESASEASSPLPPRIGGHVEALVAIGASRRAERTLVHPNATAAMEATVLAAVKEAMESHTEVDTDVEGGSSAAPVGSAAGVDDAAGAAADVDAARRLHEALELRPPNGCVAGAAGGTCEGLGAAGTAAAASGIAAPMESRTCLMTNTLESK
mmetsp:Transcript_37631/g.108641  ORF Transcript_37631/g.108641 Transcript_37631/m.108641 type:complete len:298 (-) Transcript_37631:823-1716(-)